MDVHIDESGCNNGVARVDDRFTVARSEVLANLGDQTAGNAHVAQRIERRRWIDDAAASN